MATLNDVLVAGNTTGGKDIVVSSGDSVTLTENAAVPGGAPAAGTGKLWVRDDAPNTLAFTNDAGTTSHLGLYSEMVLSVRDFGAVGDGVTDDTSAIQDALDAAELGSIKTVVFPPGNYLVSQTISHPATVVVRGAGASSTFITQSSGASPLWSFATGITRAELAELRFNGQGGEVIANRTGTCISMVGALFVTVRNVEIWDFARGIDLSDGSLTVYSAYNVVGPQVLVNRCTTGIRALANCNNTLVFGSRVFYSWGANNEGVGVDVVDSQGLTLLSNTIEAADVCLRIRSGAQNSLRALIQANYLETGPNPVTTVQGSAYDVVVDNSTAASSANLVQGLGNTLSANRGYAELQAEAGHDWDMPSGAPFGALVAGPAVAKRNLIRNGGFGYYNASYIPDWSIVNGLTIAEETGDFVTGVRSIRATANATNSYIANIFAVSDPSVEWVTMGVRYKVISGTGFSVTAASGSNLAQRPDPRPADSTWRELQVTVRRDPGSQVGQLYILPDNVAGTGECLIDEVWAVAGRYAVDSTQYGERIEMLQAPITIASATNIYANSLWGPIDITNLSAVLGSPLDDFSTAPMGVCGGLLRLRLTVKDGSGSGLLTAHNWIYLDIPGAGAVIGSTVNRVTAIYANNPVEGVLPVRATIVSGGVNRGSGALPYDYEVALVGWILR